MQPLERFPVRCQALQKIDENAFGALALRTGLPVEAPVVECAKPRHAWPFGVQVLPDPP